MEGVQFKSKGVTQVSCFGKMIRLGPSRAQQRQR
jgi:hypothetical protein